MMEHDAPNKVENIAEKAGPNSNFCIHYERYEALVRMVSMDPWNSSPRYMGENGTAVWVNSPYVA